MGTCVVSGLDLTNQNESLGRTNRTDSETSMEYYVSSLTIINEDESRFLSRTIPLDHLHQLMVRSLIATIQKPLSIIVLHHLDRQSCCAQQHI